MSYDEFDAQHDEMMDRLYLDFKVQFEDEFILERMERFYKDNTALVEAPIRNLNEAILLFESRHYSPAFIHAIISIEVGIKSVVLKPILYSLTIDKKAGDLLYKQTFRYKSLNDIDGFYYSVLEEITGLNFKNKRRENHLETIWSEWATLQKLRNDVIHQGFPAEITEAENAINMASYVCNEIIPTVLDRFHKHIENEEIHAGSREYVLHRKRLEASKK